MTANIEVSFSINRIPILVELIKQVSIEVDGRERKNIQVSKTSSPYLWNTERLFPILISCVPDSVGVERAIVEEVCGRGYNKYLSPSNTARSFNCIKAEINSC